MEVSEISINGETYVKKSDLISTDEGFSFIEKGKIYLIRTVTMIYTGRVKAISKSEILLGEAAWIPETDRWSISCKEETFKEVEPYFRDVILSRGAILDVTEITKTQTKAK